MSRFETIVELIERHALAAVDPRATLWIRARDQHPVLRDRRAVEPEERRSLHVVQSPTALLLGHAVEDLQALSELGARELLRHALHVHGCAPPTGTDESKIAIATSGRAAR